MSDRMSEDRLERILAEGLPKVLADEDDEIARLEGAEPIEVPPDLRERVLSAAREAGAAVTADVYRDMHVLEDDSVM